MIEGHSLSKPALFRALGYRPHPGQMLVHRSQARIRVLACGVRWGKSVCAAMESVAFLMEPCEESKGWVVAPTYDLSQRVFDRVHMCLVERLKHRIELADERELRLVVRNLSGGTSELRAKSADNKVSLLGEGLEWLVVDEAAKLPRTVWENHLTARLVDKKGRALLLSTPAGANWFEGLYRRGQAGRDPEVESWQSPSWSNPLLDRETIEAERRRLPQDAFDQEYGAMFIGGSDPPCDVCGWPLAQYLTGIILTGSTKPVDCCTGCGGWIDKNGRTIVPQDKHGRRGYMKALMFVGHEGGLLTIEDCNQAARKKEEADQAARAQAETAEGGKRAASGKDWRASGDTGRDA